MKLTMLLNPVDTNFVEIHNPDSDDATSYVQPTDRETTVAAESLIMLCEFTDSKNIKDSDGFSCRLPTSPQASSSFQSPIVLGSLAVPTKLSPISQKHSLRPYSKELYTSIISNHQKHKKSLLTLISSPQSNTEASQTSISSIKPFMRHCKVKGCLRFEAYEGKCLVHKGMKLCQTSGCNRLVQSRGSCKSHGGGARCKYDGCSKGAISKGYCRTHGGGTRCAFPNCVKWAQRLGYCVRHSKQIHIIS